ncbi:MAG: hypothetical protein K0S07_998 [Chlamydiales bacterium]|jgi:hypothetical protein|nr:hypothetical protein [Chlamydiales bacterium]
MHPFIIQPGEWLGRGSLSFSFSEETIPFFTKWVVAPLSDTSFAATQMVEIQGESPRLNHFVITNIQAPHFTLSMENEAVGSQLGHGHFDEKQLLWEFKGATISGYEKYTLTEGGYSIEASYFAEDTFSTKIEGSLWKKA